MPFRKKFFNRTTIYLMVFMAISGLVGLNFWGFFFLTRLEKNILYQLQQQLVYLGKISARSIDAAVLEQIYPGQETALPALSYQQLLYEIKNSGDLENVLLLTPTQAIWIDYRVDYQIGDTLTTPAINDSLFELALRGQDPTPELFEFAGEYFLTGFTPIVDSRVDDVCAVLLLETPAHFFSILKGFKQGLFYAGISGLLVLLFFSMLIIFALGQLLKTEQRLQEQTRLAHLGRMAAMVAHEIRNPLSIIKGAAEVLKKKYAAQQDELFDFIPEEIERLNRLVSNFLLFSRQRQLTLSRLDPKQQIASVVSQIKDPRISTQFNAPDTEILLDRDAFKQILLNILDNARKAVPESGQIAILTQLSPLRSRRYLIQISDDGAGIPSENLAKIFDPFFSTRATGSGLGLPITKQLVEQLNGSIEISSQPDKGTTVTIDFSS